MVITGRPVYQSSPGSRRQFRRRGRHAGRGARTSAGAPVAASA